MEELQTSFYAEVDVRSDVVVCTEEEVTTFAEAVGWPVVVKTPRGGYDGKGVMLADTVDDVRDWLSAAAERGETLLLEERVPFVRELSVLLARSPSGQAAAWPVVETVQTDGICTEVIAPAPDLEPEAARAATLVGLDIAAALEVTGVMAVELFELADGSVVVNELAMRPHNSGHWTQDGAVTSQFAQHLRAVLDLPLGSTAPTAAATVMVNLLGDLWAHGEPRWEAACRHPGVKLHLYGKLDPRPGRKMGHVTFVAPTLAAAQEAARIARIGYREGKFGQLDLLEAERTLADTGLDPSRLELEITESTLLGNLDSAEEAMLRLKALGVKLALDDFGTGYSSLLYLRRFPFDRLKIDRSFVLAIEKAADAAAIVHAIVSLGRGLGMKVTAEGVETAEQHLFLRAAGVHCMQGYRFGRPMDRADLSARLAVPGTYRSIEGDAKAALAS